jgi:hypothetical protein
MKWKFALIFLVLPCMLRDGMAQAPHPILSEFVLIRQHRGILLKWTIKGGNQCEGTKVFRAVDQQPFELIEHISGICGGADFDETYTHHDTLPAKNAENHYRLEMGDLGFTETVSLFYDDFGQNDHARLTDLQTGTVTLLVNNAQSKPLTVMLVDMNGRVAGRQQSTSNAITLHTSHLSAGIYIYVVSGEGLSPLSGRIVAGY